jgi:hypothetical protein
MPTLPIWPPIFMFVSNRPSPPPTTIVASIHNRYVIVQSGLRRTVSEHEFRAALPLCSRIDVERFPHDPYVTNLCYL